MPERLSKIEARLDALERTLARLTSTREAEKLAEAPAPEQPAETLAELRRCWLCEGPVADDGFVAVRGWRAIAGGDPYLVETPRWACRSCVASYAETLDDRPSESRDEWLRASAEGE